MFLKVAEEIRDGSRPQHAEAIAAKREEIYDWVDQRIEGMFASLRKQEELVATTTTTTTTEPLDSELAKEEKKADDIFVTEGVL